MINPDRTYRAFGTVISNERSGSLRLIKIQMNNGSILEAVMNYRECSLKRIPMGELGTKYNFQARFSILSDKYIITKIGSKSKRMV